MPLWGRRLLQLPLMSNEFFNFLRNLVITLTLSFIPSLLLIRFLYKRDKSPDAHDILFRTFFLGFAGAIPVLIITFPLAPFFYKFQNPMLAAIYWSVFCAAVPEEIIKFLIILKYSSKKSAFDEPMDGIVYGVTASLGFATIESIMHITKIGYGIALTRAIMAVPAHACFGAIMGYFIGMAHFHKKGGTAIWFGLLVAIFLHSLYDFPLIANQIWDLNTNDPINFSIKIGFFTLFATTFVFLILWTIRIINKVNKE